MELFKDVINGILNNNKALFSDPEAVQLYNPFLCNRALSYHADTLFYANQLNQLNQLDKDCQITFFLNTVRANRRPFVRWSKPIRDDDLKAVKTYFGYSDNRAAETLKILTEEQITIIKERINTGD